MPTCLNDNCVQRGLALRSLCVILSYPYFCFYVYLLFCTTALPCRPWAACCLLPPLLPEGMPTQLQGARASRTRDGGLLPRLAMAIAMCERIWFPHYQLGRKACRHESPNGEGELCCGHRLDKRTRTNMPCVTKNNACKTMNYAYRARCHHVPDPAYCLSGCALHLLSEP